MGIIQERIITLLYYYSIIIIITRLIVHHADGFSFGQLQGCHPSLPLHLSAGLQMIGAAAAAQHDVAGVLGVNVRGG